MVPSGILVLTQKETIMELWLVTQYDVEPETEEHNIPFQIGIFDDEKIAENITMNLQQIYGDKYLFLMTPFDLNQTYVRSEDDLEELAGDTLESLIKSGHIDYKIDESGKFLYELTEKGRKDLDME